MFFYSIPVYLVGFGILMLFEPSFGVLPLPFFFHPLDYEAPFEDPWRFFRAMLVPWLVVAAPLAAVCLRLTGRRRLAGAVFCATPPALARDAGRSRRRGSLFYSLPVYLFGFGLLLLFEPSFGVLPLPFFFHPLDYEAPLEDPWAVRAGDGGPVDRDRGAARRGRAAAHAGLDPRGARHRRTCAPPTAKGLSRRRVIRHHAAPAGYARWRR